jgi:hypothetical protein
MYQQIDDSNWTDAQRSMWVCHGVRPTVQTPYQVQTVVAGIVVHVVAAIETFSLACYYANHLARDYSEQYGNLQTTRIVTRGSDHWITA